MDSSYIECKDRESKLTHVAALEALGYDMKKLGWRSAEHLSAMKYLFVNNSGHLGGSDYLTTTSDYVVAKDSLPVFVLEWANNKEGWN